MQVRHVSTFEIHMFLMSQSSGCVLQDMHSFTVFCSNVCPSSRSCRMRWTS